ncbi:hypothetical protein PLESTB_001555600 [Pleodorina starrii]|uniref:GST N-terminal domain-containing protein n=1 Tax=Pleodorina starrii TaxID=330485 RepID=A0A9W6BX80_9CHLO|nr:hypothetical protein PLESTM_001471500 [Pleodorina starrii]GLC59934.1 hypothetical protein PLESTB_001555600 [Pleodorina starrii]GLC72841.1 hypothetical protein PLESTF_001298800 [Pleodorina starrii]
MQGLVVPSRSFVTRSASYCPAQPRPAAASLLARRCGTPLHTPAGGQTPRSGVRAMSILQNIMKGFSSGSSKASEQGARPAATLSFSDNAPSWEQLADLVRAKHSEFGVDFWADPNEGPTHPLALKRLFGSTEPVRVKLYRDHAAWCPYCHKVWLQLEEKRIPYVIEKINMRCYGDKPPSFTAKVPSGLLPVIELDGRVVTESAVIMGLLEDTFPDHKPLMPPAGTTARQRADLLMRLERKLFSDWLNWLCSDWNHERAKQQFEATMDLVASEMEREGGPYFLGSDISLVDITFCPMLERIAASLSYYKGSYIRGQGRWPAVDRWFVAMESRPTYLGTRSDFYTHAHDLPPQLGGCAMHADGEPVAAAIDGTDGTAWRLPLPPLSATSLPEPYSPGENPPVDRLEAAARLVRNHEAVVKFALRGPGRPGPRPVMAPLADPTALPALEHSREADAALRHVAHALLVGVEAKQVSTEALQTSPSAGLSGAAVVSAAEYLRDRVGVPRDMRYPAARQLRAHLNWLIDNLRGASV